MGPNKNIIREFTPVAARQPGQLGQLARAAVIAARNSMLGGNLASLSLLAKPGEFYSYIAQCLLSYRCAADNRGVPQKHIFEALQPSGEFTVELPPLLPGNRWFTNAPSLFVDIASLCLLCRFSQPKLIFEIGTFDGYSAAAMALNSSLGAIVHTLDLPANTRGALANTAVDVQFAAMHSSVRRMVWEGTPVADRIVQLFGDSAEFDFSPYERKIDLFFIDGAHSYEYVRSDTRNALLCAHPGSILAWHDFGKMGVNGVERAVREAITGKIVYVVPGGSLAYAVI